MRAAWAIAAVSVSTGCGGEAARTVAREERSAPARLSARFVERTTDWMHGVRSVSVTRGAYDWTNRRGYLVERGKTYSEHVIQIGDACYRRFGPEPWKQVPETDVRDICELGYFPSPAATDELMSAVAGGWREVGRASVRGVPTTHYRGELNIGAVEGPIEMWVDGDGVVRRSRQRGPDADSYVTVTDYYDFGVDVRVRRPTTEGSR
ncbi:MAG: hypothetical protein M3321_03115 [Actinomycetota bacterium]|nr:hypothetical protein [Actinomycetota bacterium]